MMSPKVIESETLNTEAAIKIAIQKVESEMESAGSGSPLRNRKPGMITIVYRASIRASEPTSRIRQEMAALRKLIKAVD